MIINRNNLFCDTDAEEVKIYSYQTLVAVVKNGKLYRIWGGYSSTTMRHINQILATLDMPKISKKRMGGIAMRLNGQSFPEIDKLLNSGKKLQLEYDKKRQELRFFEVSVKKIKIEEEEEDEV